MSDRDGALLDVEFDDTEEEYFQILQEVRSIFKDQGIDDT